MTDRELEGTSERLALLTERVNQLATRIEREEASRRRELDLQASEYARRLGELNAAHDRAADDRAHFYTKDSWSVFETELRRWRDLINAELAETRGAARTWSVAMGVVVTIIGILVHFLKV